MSMRQTKYDNIYLKEINSNIFALDDQSIFLQKQTSRTFRQGLLCMLLGTDIE